MTKDEKMCRELLAKNLKRFRGRLGFSQLDFALELGISTTFLSGIELGQKWVSPATLAKLAQALNIEIYELFKPEHEDIKADISTGIVKYLDIVDDTLVKYIARSIEPAIEQLIRRSVVKMRKYHEGQTGEPGEESLVIEPIPELK
jgi:transcriptional regulator with XRE-family HTH domain